MMSPTRPHRPPPKANKFITVVSVNRSTLSRTTHAHRVGWGPPAHPPTHPPDTHPPTRSPKTDYDSPLHVCRGGGPSASRAETHIFSATLRRQVTERVRVRPGFAETLEQRMTQTEKEVRRHKKTTQKRMVCQNKKGQIKLGVWSLLLSLLHCKFKRVGQMHILLFCLSV